ncbi:amyloid-beta A4 precursor protein-binding family B member 2 isoform X1 [Tachysurus ichikawai]
MAKVTMLTTDGVKSFKPLCCRSSKLRDVLINGFVAAQPLNSDRGDRQLLPAPACHQTHKPSSYSAFLFLLLDLQAATVNPDPSLKEFEGATLRYASLKLRNPAPVEEEDSSSINSDPEAKCFAVRSLGWVEMAEEDLAPGKSSVAVNNCIRQLSYCKNDIRDTVGIWGEGKDMYLILENNMLNLVDPMDRSVLHSQPIASIRVWGVGRDNGRRIERALYRLFVKGHPNESSVADSPRRKEDADKRLMASEMSQ